MKTLAGGMFRSTTSEGLKSKTTMGIVMINGDPTIHVYQRSFTKSPDKSSMILRKCGDYFYCQNAVAFKFQSFLTVVNFVDHNKELIYKELETVL